MGRCSSSHSAAAAILQAEFHAARSGEAVWVETDLGAGGLRAIEYHHYSQKVLREGRDADFRLSGNPSFPAIEAFLAEQDCRAVRLSPEEQFRLRLLASGAEGAYCAGVLAEASGDLRTMLEALRKAASASLRKSGSTYLRAAPVAPARLAAIREGGGLPIVGEADLPKQMQEPALRAVENLYSFEKVEGASSRGESPAPPEFILETSSGSFQVQLYVPADAGVE